MDRVLVYFGRFALILLGYACASLAASIFLHVMALGALGVGQGEAPQFVMGSAYFSVPVAALFVAYFAFLPALPAILLAEALGWRDWLHYAIAGALIALIVIGFFVHTAPSSSMGEPGYWGAMLGGGMVGGLAYWLVAGRVAGNWRSRVRRAAGQDSEKA